ncbi:MAG: biotin--[acetyl-CoA-carboxylase] ligase [Hyphomicrobiales bacterium]|nr:biotin--[acetyl-CoA-carboxylase] ligase [Hyphomicrobiales bacterium]
MNREATDLAGVRHETYETLGSTNAEALARARSGERGALWISARTQDAGRGRRGSAWTSTPGNLFATLLLGDPSPPPLAPQLSFVAALALHDAVAECAAQVGPLLKVKWPNDLLLGGAKLAGILIEGESAPTFAVVIGFGVNCATHPDNTPYPATDLAAAGALVGPASLLAALAQAMPRRLVQWARGDGFAGIRADWLKRAAGLGQDIRVRLPEREFSGRFEGLDDAGHLVVRGPAGLVAVTAGEVFDLG